MREKRFVEAVQQLKFAEILKDEEDFSRVNDLLGEAFNGQADRVLLGFRVRGPVIRILWAVIEVIKVGPLTEEDRPAGLPPDGDFEAVDLHFDRFVMTQGTAAELDELKDAKPDGLKESPAALVAAPGRISWKKLLRLFDNPQFG